MRKDLSQGPIRWVVNTHADEDHTGGNEVIGKAGSTTNNNPTPIVAHENVLTRMSLPGGGQTPRPTAAWPTSSYVRGTKDFFFNDEPVMVYHVPTAHTDGDSVVLFRRSDVVMAGDLYVTTTYPRIELGAGGGVQGVIDGLNLILDLAVPKHEQEGGTYVIPGHGRVSDEADVLEYRDMVTIVRDRDRRPAAGRCDDRAGEGRPADAGLRPPVRRHQRAVHDGDVHRGHLPGSVAPARRGAQVRGGPVLRTAAVAGISVWLTGLLLAQQPPAAPPAASPQSIAPIDLTGTWVSVVSEDWRWRMMTPAKGDYASLPLSDAGRKAADAWDYQASQTPENACKPFGVGNIMRMPGRIRISWQNPSTLKLDFDAGTQTRLLNFVAGQAPAEPSWQGYSVAAWEIAGQQVEVDRNGIPVAPAPAGGRGRGGRGARRSRPRGGALRVATTNFRPGFLRKNGVPYSDSGLDRRVLRPHLVSQRRRGAARAHRGRGPAVPAGALHHQHELQARAVRRQVEGDAVRHRSASRAAGGDSVEADRRAA